MDYYSPKALHSAVQIVKHSDLEVVLNGDATPPAREPRSAFQPNYVPPPQSSSPSAEQRSASPRGPPEPVYYPLPPPTAPSIAQSYYQHGSPQSNDVYSQRSYGPNRSEAAYPSEERPRRSWFIPAAIAAVITALIVGGAVGGGVGASLGKCQNDLSALQSTNATGTSNSTCTYIPSAGTAPKTTTTISATAVAASQTVSLDNYSVAAADTVELLDVDCDSLTNQNQKSRRGEQYTVVCGKDFGTGALRDAANNAEAQVADVGALVAYSVTDCLEACSNFSYFAAKRGSADACGSVTFRSNMAENLESNRANCWLKNSTVAFMSAKTSCDNCMSANKISG
ncbi:hypothetical protein F4778DRAFT_753736 [Xylariomycetidae sp. FL2044]|nr:hypothetical protein F4778DRAFT_753736 [Xylariomycetidae sp. FL2044]